MNGYVLNGNWIDMIWTADIMKSGWDRRWKMAVLEVIDGGNKGGASFEVMGTSRGPIGTKPPLNRV